MKEIFVTSDLHLRHNKPFLYEPRGFTSIEEHDEAIVERWNSVVKPDDMVFLLGDLILNDNEKGIKLLKQLNGQLCVVWGNHDTLARQELIAKELPMTIILGYAHQMKYGKWTFYLSHYPTKVGNYDDTKYHKTYCLCGHTHTQNRFADINDSCYHVELDAHNNFPVNIEEIKLDLKNYIIKSEKSE